MWHLYLHCHWNRPHLGEPTDHRCCHRSHRRTLWFPWSSIFRCVPQLRRSLPSPSDQLPRRASALTSISLPGTYILRSTTCIKEIVNCALKVTPFLNFNEMIVIKIWKINRFILFCKFSPSCYWTSGGLSKPWPFRCFKQRP